MAIPRKHFYWEFKEIQSYVLTAIVLSFILSFTDWGTDVVDLALGATNWFVSFIVVLLSLFVHDLGHRYYALKKGYKSRFKIQWFALLLSFLICIITNGRLKVFLAGTLVLTIITHHRIGKFTFRPDHKHEALIALAGPLCSLILAGLVKTIGVFIPFSSFIVDKFVAFNVLYAVYTMLPIPPFDGFRLFWWSRLWYAFAFGAVFGFMFLALFDVISIVIPLIIGFLSFLGFYFHVEK